MSIDIERCSMSGGDLWIGLPPDPKHGRISIERMPRAPKSVLFVEGPEQSQLVAEFVKGPCGELVENLMIGTSHDYIRVDRPTPYDFSGAVGALKDARLPALRRLSLGDMELLFNGHGYHGHLGNITHVFDIAPQLEELWIYGSAEVSSPVRHDQLRTLIVAVDDIAGHCEPISQASFTHLLTSRFGRLKQLQLSLEAEEAPLYRIPEVLFSADAFSALEAISIDCLEPQDALRLSAWKESRGLRW